MLSNVDLSDYSVQQEIIGMLPHKYPFLFVDRVLDLKPGLSAQCLKAVSAGEEYFVGHFPNYKVMPGVIMTEFMAQAACICALSKYPKEERNREFFLAGLEGVKFKKVVRPGFLLRAEVSVEKTRASLWIFKGEIYDGGETEKGDLVASALIKAGVGEKIVF